MTDLERTVYLIAQGEADNAAEWARKVAKAAFSDNYHLRSFKVWRRPVLEVIEMASAQHNCHISHDPRHHHRSC